MNIEDVLKSLDPADDDHWTSDGLPRLDVINSLCDSPVSRSEVSEVGKNFTRENPVLENGATGVQGGQKDGTGDGNQNGDDDDDSNDALDVAQERVNATNDQINKLKKKLAVETTELDVEITKASGDNNDVISHDDIAAYQKSQAKEREDNVSNKRN